MKERELLTVLHIAERLKNNNSPQLYFRRTPRKRRGAFVAFGLDGFFHDEFSALDMDRVIKMCLVHDIEECFNGDIPSFQKTEENEQTEERLLAEWVTTLPEPFASEMQAVFLEMNERETPEAMLYKALDNMEAVIQHSEADLSTWIEKECAFSQTYGEDKVSFSDYLTR